MSTESFRHLHEFSDFMISNPGIPYQYEFEQNFRQAVSVVYTSTGSVLLLRENKY